MFILTHTIAARACWVYFYHGRRGEARRRYYRQSVRLLVSAVAQHGISAEQSFDMSIVLAIDLSGQSLEDCARNSRLAAAAHQSRLLLHNTAAMPAVGEILEHLSRRSMLEHQCPTWDRLLSRSF